MVWRSEIEYFPTKGWRCIAPDVLGYGGSSVLNQTGSYAISEIVTDMLEWHNALAREPAIRIGHDWVSPVVWSPAAPFPARWDAVVNMCIQYFAQGFTLADFSRLVARNLYPSEKYHVGRWDYFLL